MMMMMREILPLQVLCLRAVGSHACNAEVTFAPINPENTDEFKEGEGGNDNDSKVEHQKEQQVVDGDVLVMTTPSRASRLLRSFHLRGSTLHSTNNNATRGKGIVTATLSSSSIDQIPMSRTPCFGPGTARRLLANEVDLHYPLIAARYPNNDTSTNNNNHSSSSGSINYSLVMQYGSSALDCLQSYVDSLVELGRMDDGRLGLHFFQEWKANILLSPHRQEVISTVTVATETMAPMIPNNTKSKKGKGSSSKKRKRGSNTTPTTTTTLTTTTTTTTTSLIPVGSMSLHNCAISDRTIQAFIDSGVGFHLAVLDLSGIHGLTDDHVQRLLPHCHATLRRLSVKNCRRLTNATLQLFLTNTATPCFANLQVLDVGGCYNMPLSVLVQDVLSSKYHMSSSTSSSTATNTTTYHLPQLIELHASGLGWTDFQLQHLAETMATRDFSALSIGFSSYVTANGLKQALPLLATSLLSLSLHFCTPEPSSTAGLTTTNSSRKSLAGGSSGGTGNNNNNTSAVVVDNALLGFLGRNLPQLSSLDIRGNAQVTSLTGWYDGRVSANWPIASEPFLVLARYTGVTAASLDDTKRIHPLHAAQLVCIIDGISHANITGCGGGIVREC